MSTSNSNKIKVLGSAYYKILKNINMILLRKIAGKFIHQKIGINKFTNYYLQNTPKSFHQLASQIAISYYHLQNVNDLESIAAYEALKKETKDQFLSLTKAGFEIRPFKLIGQPYNSCIEIRDAICRKKEIFVYLTEMGYGKAGVSYDNNPMLELSGIKIDGVEFCYNDLLRAVHDIFGHALTGGPFNLLGELFAGYVELNMFSEQACHALFNELIGQICSYYYDSNGHSIPKAHRDYPDQKFTLLPLNLFDRFKTTFKEAGQIKVYAK